MKQREVKKRVKNLENNSIIFFQEGKIKKAILTHKEIQFLCPKEEEYYLVYLGYLNDEFIQVEFAQDIYKEVSELCNRAIQNLHANKLLPFYEKKIENYINLIDGSFGVWYQNPKNSKEVDSFIEEMLQKHHQTPSILKRLHSLYYITGKETKEVFNLLNVVYKTSKKDDFQLMIFIVSNLEKDKKITESIELMENYITNNSVEEYELVVLYSKLMRLNTSIKQIDRADYYEDLLDDLN